MSELIEAGPGKIKKRPKQPPFKTLVGSELNPFDIVNPFNTKYKFTKELVKLREGELFDYQSIRNSDSFDKLVEECMLHVNPCRFAKEYFLGDKGSINKGYDSDRYTIVDPKRFPGVVWVRFDMPVEPDRKSSIYHKPPEHYKYFMKSEELIKYMGEGNGPHPHHYSMQVIFGQEPDNDRYMRGLYIPLMVGNHIMPDEWQGNLWYIFSTKHYNTKPVKTELFYYRLQGGIGFNKLGKEGGGRPTIFAGKTQTHKFFKKGLEDAIQELGGIR